MAATVDDARNPRDPQRLPSVSALEANVEFAFVIPSHGDLPRSAAHVAILDKGPLRAGVDDQKLSLAAVRTPYVRFIFHRQ